MHQALLPDGWQRPKGYANGVAARGRQVFVAGIGKAFRELIGNFNIAMTAVQVVALVEDRAKVEIEVTAVVPE